MSKNNTSEWGFHIIDANAGAGGCCISRQLQSLIGDSNNGSICRLGHVSKTALLC